MSGWRRTGRLVAALALLAPLVACGDGDAGGPPTINLYYAAEPHLKTVIDECNAAAAGRYRIVHRVLPRSADDQRVQLVRRLAARDTGMDVLGLDVTWTQEFASAGWLREWTGADRQQAEDGTLAGPLASARYGDRLYAVPKNANVQLLWYRTDLVDAPPATWDELIAAAQRLKAAGKPYQVVTMGAQYEGLVVLYNTIVASAGGKILSDDGGRAVFDDGAVRGLDILRTFARSGVTSASFANSFEDEARLDFQAGNGAFQLNWPFVYAAMQEDAPELAAKVRWARYPGVTRDQPAKVTIGGFHLGVSRYSRHPAEATQAALCIRSPEHQIYSAVNDGVPPTIERLYADPALAKAYPMRDVIRDELRDGAVRPLTPAYQNVSTVLSTTLSPPADLDPGADAARLRGSVQAALESRGVLP